MGEGVSQNSKTLAVIDIGTNSAQMLVARVNANGWMQVLDKEKVNLRLGKSLSKDGILTADAIAKTSEVIAHMKAIADKFHPIYRAMATYATREAKNHDQLLDAIYDRSKIRIEIIDGYEEARLAGIGMQQGLSLENLKFWAVDIGGGSTDFGLMFQNQLKYVSSLKLGAVILTRDFFPNHTYDGELIERLSDHVQSVLAPLQDEVRRFAFDRAAACSGTAKTLAIIAEQLKSSNKLKDPHGYALELDDITEIYRQMAKARSAKAIAEMFQIDESRSEIILSGTIILYHLSRLLGVTKWIISANGLREGIVADTYRRLYGTNINKTDVRWRHILAFGERFGIDELHARRVSELARSLYDLLGIQKSLPKEEAARLSRIELLMMASWLHEVGKFINHSGFQRHSYYLIANSRLLGFTCKEKEILALIVKYHRKGVLSGKAEAVLDSQDICLVNRLAGVLRLAALIKRLRKNVVHLSKLHCKNKVLSLEFVFEDEHLKRPFIERFQSEIPDLSKCLDIKILLSDEVAGD